jgi:hypothetical protein
MELPWNSWGCTHEVLVIGIVGRQVTGTQAWGSHNLFIDCIMWCPIHQDRLIGCNQKWVHHSCKWMNRSTGRSCTCMHAPITTAWMIHSTTRTILMLWYPNQALQTRPRLNGHTYHPEWHIWSPQGQIAHIPECTALPHSKEWEPALGVQNPRTRTFKRAECSPPKHEASSSLTPLDVQHPEQIPHIHALLLTSMSSSSHPCAPPHY